MKNYRVTWTKPGMVPSKDISRVVTIAATSETAAIVEARKTAKRGFILADVSLA